MNEKVQCLFIFSAENNMVLITRKSEDSFQNFSYKYFSLFLVYNEHVQELQSDQCSGKYIYGGNF